MSFRIIGLVVMVCITSVVVGQDWLQFGGPSGDFKVHSKPLANSWPETGPKTLWKRSLGDGFSSILHQAGRLYTMYRDGGEEVVVAVSAKNGETIWEHRYALEYWKDHDKNGQYFTKGPNATPVIVDDRIISAGTAGELRCLLLKTGELIWRRNLPSEYGRRKRVEEYGYSASPLLYKGHLLVQVGGENHAVIGVDPKDGTTLWESDADGVSYAQARIINLGGVDQYIFFSPKNVIGMDPNTGRFLWSHPIPVDNGNHLTPVVKCDENHIWVSSQFDSGGGRLLEITRQGDRWNVDQKWFNSKLRGSCWTLIRIGDVIYGSAGGHNSSKMTAFNWRTGKIYWQKRGYHMSQALYADGKLLTLDESGDLALARVSPEKIDVLARSQVTDAVSWTLPTLIGDRLFVRDKKHMLALSLGPQ